MQDCGYGLYKSQTGVAFVVFDKHFCVAVVFIECLGQVERVFRDHGWLEFFVGLLDDFRETVLQFHDFPCVRVIQTKISSFGRVQFNCRFA